jgi:RNA polymerase sigma-70 factor (ECF subfamily)
MSVPQPGADADAEPGVDWTALAGGTFADFYEAQYGAVVRLAAALVGRWDVAEELVQDAFIALYPRWTRISSYDAPDAWLRRVVLNRALSSLRRRAVEARVTSRLARRRFDTGPGEPRVGDADVLRAVSELPKRQAQVIALVFLEDRTVADVAVILECSENTVRTQLGRARHALALRLAVDERDEEDR